MKMFTSFIRSSLFLLLISYLGAEEMTDTSYYQTTQLYPSKTYPVSDETMEVNCGVNTSCNPFTSSSGSGDDNATTPLEANAREGPPQGETYIETTIAVYIDRIGGGLIFILGSVGNILAALVIRRPRMIMLPSSNYLIYLAITDAIVAIVGQGLRHWIRAITGVDLPSKAVWYCKVWNLIVPSATAYSVWVLMGITMERTFAVCAPLKFKEYFSKKTSRIYLWVSLFCIVGYYSYGLYLYDVVEVQKYGKMIDECRLTAETSFFCQRFRPWFEFILTSMMPMTLIVVCNIVIICQLYKNSQKWKDSEGNERSNVNTKSLTRMLLTINFMFLVLTTPIRILFILNVVFPAGYLYGAHKNAINRLLWSVALFCLYLNHACNFFLYCISGQKFREELLVMLGCRSRGQSGSVRSKSISKANSNSISKNQSVAKIDLKEQSSVTFDKNSQNCTSESNLVQE